MRPLPAVLVVACVLAGPGMAQIPPRPSAPAAKGSPAPPPPLMVPPVPRRPLPETWDEIPESIRKRLEPRINSLAFQSVLKIEPATFASEPRMVEAGTLLAVQKVSPARGVRLTSAPRRQAYGTVGAVLWQARDARGDLWCYRNPSNVVRVGNFYCYRDNDGDGVFDALFESPYWSNESLFQTLSLGKDEKIKKPVSYVPADPPAYEEIVALRYSGVYAGLISDDGMIRPGIVRIELVVGQNPRTVKVLKTYRIELDLRGRGRLRLPTGHDVDIDQVEVGGRARVKVTGALEPGEGYLIPPVTRESLLRYYRRELERGR